MSGAAVAGPSPHAARCPWFTPDSTLKPHVPLHPLEPRARPCPRGLEHSPPAPPTRPPRGTGSPCRRHPQSLPLLPTPPPLLFDPSQATCRHRRPVLFIYSLLLPIPEDAPETIVSFLRPQRSAGSGTMTEAEQKSTCRPRRDPGLLLPREVLSPRPPRPSLRRAAHHSRPKQWVKIASQLSAPDERT